MRSRAIAGSGAQTTAATVESLHQVEPGLSEYDLEAITAANLLRRGILPSVYLYAVDERISSTSTQSRAASGSNNTEC